MNLRDATREMPRPARQRGTAMLDEAEKGRIYRLWRQGATVDALADQLGRSRAAITRVVNEQRAERLLETKLEYMHHASFDDPAEREVILGPMPESDGNDGRMDAPSGLPPYLASLYEAPLLNREQEAHLFRKMNYLKYQAHRLREKLDPARATASQIEAIERLQEEALAVKNQIISANLRLVVSIAKRHLKPTNNLFELVSDGNISLIRAVEKFDYSRGNKFSTYASWAIMRNFARTIPREDHRRDRYVTGNDEMFEAAADSRADEHEQESVHQRMKAAVQQLLDRLDDREQRIIISRFGIDGSDALTLEQLGRELGITKERVRQLETRAQEKLRRLAGAEVLDLAEAG
jgi:RNA polymerase primary sigma factor